jgi:hypothetical protein
MFGHLPTALRYVLTAGSFGTFGTVGCLVGGVVTGVVVALLGTMVTVVLMVAMLGKRDDHSPFTRLMMIICAVTKQPPEAYLPAAGPEDRAAA